MSFVIPSRNEEANIEKCLRGIMAVDYPEDMYEIIVADGHSQDKTAELAEKLGVRVIMNDKIIQSAGRNLGARNSKGELIAFVDADIILGPEWLRKAIVHFSDPTVAAVGNLPGIPDDSNWIEKVWFLYANSRYSDNRAVSVNWLASGNIIFAKDVFNDIGGFDESIKYTEDVAIGLKAKEKGYSLILDPNLESVHLDYQKTLSGFIKRQHVGGRAILQLFKADGLKNIWRITFFIAFYLVNLFLFAIGMFVDFRLSALSLLLMIALAVFVAVRSCTSPGSFRYVLPLAFLLFISGVVRAVAFVFPGKR